VELPHLIQTVLKLIAINSLTFRILSLWLDNNTCRKVRWCSSWLRLIGTAGESEKVQVSIADAARELDKLTAIFWAGF